MAITFSKVLNILDRIPANSGTISIIQAKYLDKIDVEGNKVNIFLNIPSYAQHLKAPLMEIITDQIMKVEPDAEINIHYGTQDQSSNPLPQVKHVIAVGSGKGGVGKSTVSANLALSLSNQGNKVGLLDADFYGPSMPTMFGLKNKQPQVKSVYGKHKIVPLQKYGIQVMSIGFVVDEQQAVVLRGPRLGGLMKQFIYDTAWDELDYLIIDLPPGTGDIQLTLVQTLPLTGAVIVTTPQDLAVADAIKAANMFLLENINVPILGVVENMSWFTPEELPDNKYLLFGEGGGLKLADASKTVLLGQIPMILSARELGDRGIPPLTDPEHPMQSYFDHVTKSLDKQVRMVTDTRGASKIVQTT